MHKKQIDRKKAEGYIFILLFIIPILIFIFTPAHVESVTDHQINDFFDRYLFGNGWYSPSNYPFAAKITNGFSVVLAVVSGLFVGIWRRNDIVISLIPKNVGWYFLIMIALGAVMIWKSYYPQEFSTYTGRRSSFFTESFHNNPVFFLGLMVSKTVCIYLPFRGVAFVIYLFRRKK